MVYPPPSTNRGKVYGIISWRPRHVCDRRSREEHLVSLIDSQSQRKDRKGLVAGDFEGRKPYVALEIRGQVKIGRYIFWLIDEQRTVVA